MLFALLYVVDIVCVLLEALIVRCLPGGSSAAIASAGVLHEYSRAA